MFESCRNAPEFLRQSRRVMALASVFAAFGLAACSSNFIYKPEVVQGNFVSREQVQALRAGAMSWVHLWLLACSMQIAGTMLSPFAAKAQSLSSAV
jgi:hypothetical protein